MRRTATLACLLLAALAPAGTASAAPPPAAHQALSTQTHTIESGAVFARLVTYGSWAAWSRYDKATRAYQLMLLEPTGTVRQLSVPESRSPYQVGLGPLPSGEVGAVLSRCGSARHREPCALYELNVQLPVANEQLLAVPGGGSSVSLPALWKNTIAFMRTRRHLPAQVVEWQIGSHRLTPLKLPADRPRPGEGNCPHGPSCHESVVGELTSLTLRGEQVAYVKIAYFAWNEALQSELWVQAPHHAPQKLDQIAQGEAGGTRTFQSPTFAGKWLYAYRHYVEFGHVWVRYNLRTHQREQAVADLGDDGNRVGGAAPLAGGIIWELGPEEDEASDFREPLNRANEEQEVFTAGTEILSLPAVRWIPACSSRSMIEHFGRCSPPGKRKPRR